MEKIEATVLLVDDEEQFLDALSQRLETRGLKVQAVTSGEDAVKKVADHIKEIRPDLEIIMLTGHATVKSGIEAMKLGADDFLEKPVDLNLLLEKIGEAKNKRMLVVVKGRQEELKKILKSKTW